MVPLPSQDIPKRPAQGTRNCKTPLTVQPAEAGKPGWSQWRWKCSIALGNQPSTSLRYFRVSRHGLGGSQWSSCRTAISLSQCSCSPPKLHIHPGPGSPMRCCAGRRWGRARPAALLQTNLNASWCCQVVGRAGRPQGSVFLAHQNRTVRLKVCKGASFPGSPWLWCWA